MRTSQRFLGYLAILLTTLLLQPISTVATTEQPVDDRQDDVVVHLASGRTMTAKIDARTDTQQLWLRWQSPGAEVLRPIDWDRIVAAEINGNEISGKELFGLVEQIRKDVPAQPVSAPFKTIVIFGPSTTETSISNASANNMQQPKGDSPIVVDTKIGTAPQPSPVQWLDIDARPARWDNYVEPDGMLLNIAPKDKSGEVIPVRGTLDVDLIAEHAGVERLPSPFRRIAHWSQTVKSEDFGAYGAEYRLPFQDLNPEFSRDLGPHGAIHATLSIPGQGTFEATNDARIRPYSLIRDRLRQTTGQRFFPEETVGKPWER